MDGLDTWELQIKLIGWGSGSDNDGIGSLMDPVRVNGKYDATTRDAVKRFQKAHGLAPTGVVDANTFRTIDDEVGVHAVPVSSLKCPCVTGKNKGDPLCRCKDHNADTSECAGFGNKRFAGAYLLDKSKSFAGEKLAVYAMEEHEGVDKTVIWAVRALMHRAGVDRIKVTAGYRCWTDNYHEVDDTGWHHRRGTLHLGHTIEFIHPKTCVQKGKNACPECERIRAVALAKCGYQLRWHELDRVAIGEGAFDARPPATPFAMHVDTAMLTSREKQDFVKKDDDAAAPLYAGNIGLSLPMDLGEGRDPKNASTAVFYDNVEKSAGGFYPLGEGRMWHTGIHLYPTKNKSVYAMVDGDVVACRAGEAEDTKTLGSRNFLLLKHAWKGKTFYSLSMHLDGEAPSAKAKTRWRKNLYYLTIDHVEALEPGVIYRHKAGPPGTLTPSGDLGAGERAATTGAELDPKMLDPNAPANSKVIKLDTKHDDYAYTKMDGKDVGKANKAVAGLADKVKKGDVIGLEKAFSVRAGEAVGTVGKAPKDDALKALGSFVHLEVFAASALLSGAGYVPIDASAQPKVADRKEITAALVAAKLIAPPVDGVLLKEDIDAIAAAADRGKFRSVVLHMESAWSVNWKDAFQQSKTFGFMSDKDRDALGTAFLDYEWWPLAKAGAKGQMPDSPVLYHHHPIVLLLQMAYS
jgi:hypothetical protein